MNIDRAIERGKNIEAIINKSMPDFIRTFTHSKNAINRNLYDIEFEKLYDKLFLTHAKKKQVGWLSYYKGKKLDPFKFDVTGFESIKGDTPTMFQDALNGLYKEILANYHNVEKIRNYVTSVINKLRDATIDDLIIRKRMAKEVEEYDTIPQHIRAVNNSDTVLHRGDIVNMVFVDGPMEVIHYDPTKPFNHRINKKHYFIKFFRSKIETMDEGLFYRLFEEKTKLVEIHKSALKRTIRRSIKTKKLI